MTNEGTIAVDECTPDESELDGRKNTWEHYSIPIAQGSAYPSQGFIPLEKGNISENSYNYMKVYLAVGGDYTKPERQHWHRRMVSIDGGGHWTASTTPPHGYRSSVQWSEALNLWITVGTNGSDISRDDGKTWQPLDNGNWNALSLPFVVGPNGRIAGSTRASRPIARSARNSPVNPELRSSLKARLNPRRSRFELAENIRPPLAGRTTVLPQPMAEAALTRLSTVLTDRYPSNRIHCYWLRRAITNGTRPRPLPPPAR